MQFRKEWIRPAGIGLATFGSGAIAGYILGKRRASHVTIYTVGEPEVPSEEAVEHDRLLEPYVAPFDPRVVLDETDYTAVEQRVIEETVMEERAVTEVINIREAHANGAGKFNIFEGTDDEWDYDAELAKRGTVEPFIIHREEFDAQEEGNSQSSLTYYAIDDILCDEHDTPIYNHRTVVGELTFGKGSQDPSICYVRNPRLGADYEVIIDHGSYQVQVLGDEIEQKFEEGDIKHSRHPRRMREED